VDAQPDVSRARLAGGHLLAAISTSIVGILRDHYGRGPMKAKTYALDDIIVVVMRGSGFTPLEQTIMNSGNPDRVIAMREDFQRVIDEHAGRSELIDHDAVGLALRIKFEADRVWRSFRSGAGDSFFLRRMSLTVRNGQMIGGRSPRLSGKDFLLLVRRFEKICELANRLRDSQVQKPSGLECVMEVGQDFFLQTRFDINEQVAATD